MEKNNDTRQVVIDSDLFDSLYVLAMLGAGADQDKYDRLQLINRHAIKFNEGLRIKRNAVMQELEQSTRDIIRQEHRAHRMSSGRHEHTYYVKTFGGRWVPVKAVSFDKGSPFILHVEPLTIAGQGVVTWAMQADHVLYDHEVVKIIEATETPDEILRYRNLMETHRVKSSV